MTAQNNHTAATPDAAFLSLPSVTGRAHGTSPSPTRASESANKQRLKKKNSCGQRTWARHPPPLPTARAPPKTLHVVLHSTSNRVLQADRVQHSRTRTALAADRPGTSRSSLAMKSFVKSYRFHTSLLQSV